MRVLYVLGGAPGAGKTTWVKENNLENYVLHPDGLRNLFMSPSINRFGDPIIPFGNAETYSTEIYRAIDQRERRVWALLREALEFRMWRGELTVIDATHTRRDYLNQYIPLAKKWRYRLFFVRFEVPEEVLIARNDPKVRGMKAVPVDEVIRKAEQLRALNPPRSFTEISPEEASNMVSGTKWYPVSNNPVYFIGDIHGVDNLLQRFLDEHYSEEGLYVFAGDLVDRGKGSFEVLSTLMELHRENRNIIVVEGNHDIGLWYWANEDIYNDENLGVNIISKQTRKTIKEIEEKLGEKEAIEEFKKNLRQFMRQAFSPYRTYLINGEKVLVTHALLPVIPSDGIDRLSHMYTIYGIGDYEEIQELEEIFTNRHPDIVQIHGHRNPDLLPIRPTPNVFNLEGGIEFGGEFRAVKFYSRDEYEPITYKSDYIFVSVKEKINRAEEAIFSAASESDKIKILIHHPFIRVTKQKPWKHILSLNFSRGAWRKKIWSQLTVTARGLFVDTKKMEVVMRGFNKFFYPGETDIAAEEILRQSPAPYKIIRKHNGFLLLVSYNPEIDEILWATKSRISHFDEKGKATNPFVQIAMETLTPNQKAEIQDIAMGNPGYTYLFEIVNPVRDPHVVLETPGVYFLARLRNSIENYEVDLENPFTNIPSPQVYKVVHSYDEIFPELEKIDQMAKQSKNIEGTVIYDSNNHPVFKHKTPFYSMWKRARGLLRILKKMRYIEPTKQGYDYRELIRIAAFMRDNAEKYIKPEISILDVMIDYYGIEDYPFTATRYSNQ